MIRTENVRYQNNAFNDYEIKHGIYFPDAVINAVKSIYEQDTTNTPATTQTNTLNIPIEDAKTMVIKALKKFEPSIGEKAEEILMNDDRTKITEVPIGQMKKMYCLQAGITEEHLIQKGMFSDENRTEAGIVNDRPYAVIRMDYDGTMNSVLYLAHELGHAIADDLQIECGNNFLTNPAHMEDIQAYFIQNIVRIDLEKNENLDIAKAVQEQYKQEFLQYKSYYDEATGNNDPVLHARPPAFMLASSIAQHLIDKNDLREHSSKVLLGRYGASTINQTLAAVGIERAEQMQDMLVTSIPPAPIGGGLKPVYEAPHI